MLVFSLSACGRNNDDAPTNSNEISTNSQRAEREEERSSGTYNENENSSISVSNSEEAASTDDQNRSDEAIGRLTVCARNFRKQRTAMSRSVVKTATL